MKRIIIGIVMTVAVLGSACGSTVDEVDVTGTTRPDESTSTSTSTTSTTSSTVPEPDRTQRKLLDAAAERWAANEPDVYELTYNLACECDGGPWRIRVENGENVRIDRIDGLDGWSDAPYGTVDDVLAEIGSVLDEGRFPVRVEYDPDFGYPVTYVFNEPDLPVDGGFIFSVTDFDPDPPPVTEDAEALAAARELWAGADLVDYDYTFEVICFCPEEYRGPYEASVRDGRVTAATFKGRDLLDVEMLQISDYSEIIRTIETLFDEVDRAIDEAQTFTVDYHPTLGYPESIYIDWVANMADEEIGYTVAGLRPAGVEPVTCSTTGWGTALVPQDGLPAPVAATREAIFDAAMACDFDALEALADAGEHPFLTSFGGSGAELFRRGEARGDGILRTLVEHLNLAYTSEVADGVTYYTWPSALRVLEAPDGTGLPADDYAALLELYSLTELEEMFEAIGGYIGWRHGISGDGEWRVFIAGD